MAGVIAAYRLNAANCFDIARENPNPTRKLALLDMAQAWLRLGEINKKFENALLVATPQSKPTYQSQLSDGLDKVKERIVEYLAVQQRAAYGGPLGLATSMASSG